MSASRSAPVPGAALGATVVWVLLRVRPVEEARFLAAAAALAERSLADEPGCLQYDVVSLDPAVRLYGIYEVYRDEAALAAHHAASHYAAWDAVAPTFFAADGATVRVGARVIPASS